MVVSYLLSVNSPKRMGQVYWSKIAGYERADMLTDTRSEGADWPC